MIISEDTAVKLAEYTKVANVKFIYNSGASEDDDALSHLYGTVMDTTSDTPLGMFKMDISESQIICDSKLELALVLTLISGKDIRPEFSKSVTALEYIDKMQEPKMDDLWDRYNNALISGKNVLHIVQTWDKNDLPEYADLYIMFNIETKALEAEYRQLKAGSGLSSMVR